MENDPVTIAAASLLRSALLWINSLDRRYDTIWFSRWRSVCFPRVGDRLFSGAPNIRTNLSSFQIVRSLNCDVTNAITRASQNALRILECGSIIKPEVDVLRVNCDVYDTVTQTVAGTITNRHGTVRVIDILVTRPQLFQNERAEIQRQILNLTIV